MTRRLGNTDGAREQPTLTSSGARSVASLTPTGATSSMAMEGRLDTTLISGTAWEKIGRKVWVWHLINTRGLEDIWALLQLHSLTHY
jgi:hypothetical protein